MTLFDEILHPGDVFSKYPEVTKIFDMFAMAVHPHHRGKGIATQLLNQAIIVAKKANCNASIVMATSDYTWKIFTKAGMEVIGEKEWKDCVFNGIRPFVNVESKNVTGFFMKF